MVFFKIRLNDPMLSSFTIVNETTQLYRERNGSMESKNLQDTSKKTCVGPSLIWRV